MNEETKGLPVVALQHVACAENGVLRWMAGRKFGEAELYCSVVDLREVGPLVSLKDAAEALAQRDAELAALQCDLADSQLEAFNLEVGRDALQAELAAMRGSLSATEGALVQCHMALTGYLPGHRNNITTAAIEAADKVLGFADPSAAPSPSKQGGV